MPTLVTLTVKPSGGDYTLLNSALGAIPADIVATDETYVIECDTFSGGLNEEVTVPAITTDITRRVKIKAATGHEYVYETGTGFWIWAARNFSGAVTNQNSDYVDMDGFGVKNTGSSAARGIRSSNGRINTTYKNLVILDAPSSACLEINGIKDGVIDNVLTTNGNFGINYNNFSNSVSTNCTVINASQQAYRRVSGGSNGNLLTNCLEIGSGSFNDAGGDFHADSDYNASSEVTAPIGANSLANRTTADLVDYAGGDYRTKSTSALATAGSGGTFIGYAVESGGGTTPVSNSIVLTVDLREKVSSSSGLSTSFREKVESSTPLTTTFRNKVVSTTAIDVALRESVIGATVLTTALREKVTKLTTLTTAFREKVTKQTTLSIVLRQKVVGSTTLTTNFSGALYPVVSKTVLQTVFRNKVSNSIPLTTTLRQKVANTETLTTTLRQKVIAAETLTIALRESLASSTTLTTSFFGAMDWSAPAHQVNITFNTTAVPLTFSTTPALITFNMTPVPL